MDFHEILYNIHGSGRMREPDFGDPLGTMKTKFHGYLPNSCQDMLLNTKKCLPHGDASGKPLMIT